MPKTKYLFIDFDNTIRETIPDPTPKNPDDRRPPFKVEEIKIITGISEKLREYRDKGFFIIGVSNQSGVEKGLITEKEVKEIAVATMEKMNIYFPFYFAPYKRKGTKEQLRLRKPDIGMAELAFKEHGEPDLKNSIMVGDYISDEVFAENIGIEFIHIRDFLKDNYES